MGNKRGFTLVELLTVILIIGILVTITSRGISTTIMNNNIDQAENQIKLYTAHIANYMTEYGGVYLDVDELSPSELQTQAKSVVTLINAYLPNEIILDTDNVSSGYFRINAQSLAEDPWGTPYKVYIGINERTVIIASDGPDSSSNGDRYFDSDYGDDIIVIMNNTKRWSDGGIN